MNQNWTNLFKSKLEPFKGLGEVHFAQTRQAIEKQLGKPSEIKTPTQSLLGDPDLIYIYRHANQSIELRFNNIHLLKSIVLTGMEELKILDQTFLFTDLIIRAKKSEAGAKSIIAGLYVFPKWGLTIAEETRRATFYSLGAFNTTFPELKSTSAENLSEALTKTPKVPLRRKLLKEKLRTLRFKSRASWRITASASSQTQDAQSKFGGNPLLIRGEKPPHCTRCRSPLPLAVQLNSNDFPTPRKGKQKPFEGIFQFFHCQDEACFSDTLDGKNAFLRVIPFEADFASENHVHKSSLPQFLITQFKYRTDYPQTYQNLPMESLGILIAENLKDDYELSYPEPGDKLGGYPNWIQSDEHGQCIECGHGRKMKLLLQLSESYGGSGTLFIFYCVQHPGIFAPIGQYS